MYKLSRRSHPGACPTFRQDEGLDGRVTDSNVAEIFLMDWVEGLQWLLQLVWRPHHSANGFLGCTEAKHHIFDVIVEGQLIDVLVNCRNVAGRRHDVDLLAGDSHSPWLTGVAKVESGGPSISSNISGTS